MNRTTELQFASGRRKENKITHDAQSGVTKSDTNNLSGFYGTIDQLHENESSVVSDRNMLTHVDERFAQVEQDSQWLEEDPDFLFEELAAD
jgi:hypothetical protein